MCRGSARRLFIYSIFHATTRRLNGKLREKSEKKLMKKAQFLYKSLKKTSISNLSVSGQIIKKKLKNIFKKKYIFADCFQIFTTTMKKNISLHEANFITV
jgi:DUF1009 family protein